MQVLYRGKRDIVQWVRCMQWNSVPGTTFNPLALARVIPSTDPGVIPQYCQVWLKSEKSKKNL